MKFLTTLILIISTLSITPDLYSQEKTMRVFFRDKGPFNDTTKYNGYTILTDQSLIRRAKIWDNDSAYYNFKEDRLIYQPYIDTLEIVGADILAKLRWNNYVVVKIDSLKALALSDLDFVDSTVYISSKMLLQETDSDIDYLNNYVFESYRYGGSEKAHELLNVKKLHSMGFNGQGIIMGFIDSGFDWVDNPLFEDLNVLDEWDFLFKDSVTANQEGDHPRQHDHGTAVLSLVSSYYQDTLIGIANQASVLLAKTEDLRSETHIEEDYFAEAVEWMESKGVDIINSSLGYRYFNEGVENYQYSDFDGRSTIVANAVNNAAERGVIFFTSAGNDGKKGDSTLISPADADSVFSVGAMRMDVDSIAAFSSKGPRIDGAIYPNIVAPGAAVLAAAPSSSTLTVSRNGGTSFASPLAAGATAMFLGAHWEMPLWEVRERIFKASNRYYSPDHVYGYGMPDIQKVFDDKGISIAYPNYFKLNDSIVRVVIYVYSSSEIKDVGVSMGSDVEFPEVKAGFEEGQYYADYPNEYFNNGRAFISISASNNDHSTVLPFQYDLFSMDGFYERLFSVYQDSTVVQRGVDPTKFPTSINERKSFNYSYYSGSELHFSIGKTIANAEVYIYNLMGEQVYQGTRNISDHNSISVYLRSGMYMIVVQNGNEIFSEKFSITR